VRIHTNGSGLALPGAPGLAKSPADSDNFRCGLRVKFRQRRNISTGAPEALLDPVVDQKRDSAGAARAVSLRCGHLAQRVPGRRAVGVGGRQPGRVGEAADRPQAKRAATPPEDVAKVM
jgi:hypothetical protein